MSGALAALETQWRCTNNAAPPADGMAARSVTRMLTAIHDAMPRNGVLSIVLLAASADVPASITSSAGAPVAADRFIRIFNPSEEPQHASYVIDYNSNL